MVAEWSHSGRHSHRSMHTIGSTEVAQRRHTGGGRLRIEELSFAAGRNYYVATIRRPLCIHSATTAMPCTWSLLSHLSDRWATNLLGDPSVTILNTFKLDGDMASMATVLRTSCIPPLNGQGNHAACFEPPTATRPVLWSHGGGTRSQLFVNKDFVVTRDSMKSSMKSIPQGLCKGVLTLSFSLSDASASLVPPLCLLWPTNTANRAITLVTTVPPFGDHCNPCATMAMALPPSSDLLCLYSNVGSSRKAQG